MPAVLVPLTPIRRFGLMPRPVALQERANRLATGLTRVHKAGAISKNRQPFASRR